LVVVERGGGSPEGLPAVEGIGDGVRTSASQSKGHRWGPSGWGGSTQRCGAWGGVEAVCSGSATASMAVFGAVQEW
jgi:hypothetical protein